MTSVLFACAAVSGFATIGVVVVMLGQTISFFTDVSVVSFLTDPRWEPAFAERHFGILPLVTGSFLVAVTALLLAVPLGLLTAVYLAEYAGDRSRRIVHPALHLLAGIPTVVYGYFALTWVTPLLRTVVPGTEVFNAASAGIVVGIMVLPTVAVLSEQALRSVSHDLRDAAYAVGATTFEVVTRVVLPAASPGIVAAFMLAASRAVGETMVVTIAAGSIAKLTLDPFESIQTLTAYIVQASLGDTPEGTLVYRALFAVGTTLFLITLALNVLSRRVLRAGQRGTAT